MAGARWTSPLTSSASASWSRTGARRPPMQALVRSADAKPTPGDCVLLGLILVAAIVARVIAIDSQGLASEEAQVILQARWPVSDMLLEPTAETPFLYFALQKMLLAPDVS